MTNFQLSSDPDIIGWKLGKTNRFSVKSVYNGLTKSDSSLLHKRIWKGKIPAKIKIFLWLMTNDAILTEDNLRKRKWIGDYSCAFCDEDETIAHLFFNYPISKVIWSVVAKCRNKACFEGKIIKNPLEIICHAFALMIY